MSICKVCGTANSPDSSVCANCGEKLRVNRKQGTKKRRNKTGESRKNKAPEEIFSTSKLAEKKESIEEPIKDVFSSEEAYEKKRKNTVLEKIHELEEEFGETSQPIEEEYVEPKIVPTVINRAIVSDVIRTSESPKSTKDKKHDIPRRVIHPVKTPAASKKPEAHETPREDLPEEKQRKKQRVKKPMPVEVDIDDQTKTVEIDLKKSTVAAMSAAANSVHRSAKPESVSDEVEHTEAPTPEDELAKEVELIAVQSELSVEPPKEFSEKEPVKEQQKPHENGLKKKKKKPAAVGQPKIEAEAPVAAEQPKIEADEAKEEAPVETAVEEKPAEAPVEETPAEKAAEEQPIEAEPVKVETPAEEQPTTEVSAEKAAETEEAEKPVEEKKTETEDVEKSVEEKKTETEKVEKPVKVKSRKTEDGEKPVKVKSRKTEDGEKPVKVKSRKPQDGAAPVKVKKTKTEDGEKPAKVKSRKTEDGAAPVKGKKPKTEDGEKPAKVKSRKPEDGEKPAKTKVKKPAAADADPKKKAKADAKKIPERPAAKKKRFSDEDVEENRYVAALAYIGILILLPAFKVKESEFCKAHVRQGAAVFVYSLIISAVTLAAVLGLRALLVWTLGLSFIIYKVIMLAITAAMLVLIFIPAFSGAVAAFSGTYVQVPFVGKFVKNKKQ